MPDEHGIPTDEEIARWHARWIGENAYRVDDVVRILQEDPERGSKKIVELPWYTEQNGFKRWVKEERLFEESILEGRPILDFRGCVFPPKIELKALVFCFSHFEDAYLSRANLSGAQLFMANLSVADLSQASLVGANLASANLSKARLLWADLTRAGFRFSNLSSADLYGADLSEADFSGANLVKAQLSGAYFLNCRLEGIDLRSPDGFAECDSRTFFGRTTANKTTAWLFDKRVMEEQELGPYHAMNTCSEIRLCFRDNGLFHKAAIYYEQEEYWRTRVKLRGSLKDKILGALRLFFFEWMIGYGERPQRIIGWSVVAVVLCALIFLGCGYECEVSPRIFGTVKCSVFAPFSSEAWGNFFRCLRFSIENFTTLGFSKMQPAEGVSHWVASLEGVVGVLFVALATVTWARKAIRD